MGEAGWSPYRYSHAMLPLNELKQAQLEGLPLMLAAGLSGLPAPARSKVRGGAV